MTVQVHIPNPLRQHTQNQAVVAAKGDSVQALLEDLETNFPGFSKRIFENGRVRRFINIYLNDEDIRYLDDTATQVKPGDELCIIPAVAGG